MGCTGPGMSPILEELHPNCMLFYCKLLLLHAFYGMLFVACNTCSCLTVSTHCANEIFSSELLCNSLLFCSSSLVCVKCWLCKIFFWGLTISCFSFSFCCSPHSFIVDFIYFVGGCDGGIWA